MKFLLFLQRSVTKEPKNSEAHQCAGNAYMSKADYESAINHYKKLLKMMQIMVIATSTSATLMHQTISL